ncbi:Putative ribonuclease H protein At1g65750 [Linum perenne]
MWNQIWSWSGPNRIRCFLWLALQEKLLSNCSRVRRRMAADASCDLCRDPEESVVHILLDCSFAADSWDPGPEGWVVLNSDGSAYRLTGRATAGGLVRDSEGRGMLAYSMNLGRCSITRAEMRGAIEGLRRAWDAGHRNVILRVDSRAAISLLTSESETPHQHTMESMEFQDLQRRDWRLVVEHTFREGNRAADFLASLGYGYPFGSLSVSISDSRLGYFLRLDCFGIAEPRLISIND